MTGESLGSSVTGVGDWNVDGTPGLRRGQPGSGGRYGPGRVRVRMYSGVDTAGLSNYVGEPMFSGRDVGIAISGRATGLGMVASGKRQPADEKRPLSGREREGARSRSSRRHTPETSTLPSSVR